MDAEAVVYTSNTGYSAEYAKLLGAKLDRPVYSLDQAKTDLPKDTNIIYLGWLMANRVQGYRKAAKRYRICAVCGVGLCDTGALLNEVRKATGVPEDLPLFTLQGGMDLSKLKGLHLWMIRMLTKGLAGQKERSREEERMLELLQKGGNYVREDHLEKFMAWWKESV